MSLPVATANPEVVLPERSTVIGSVTPLTDEQFKMAVESLFAKIVTVVKHEQELLCANVVQTRTIADMQSERDALLRRQSQEAAAHIIVQGQKRKAEEDVVEENKRYRESAEQVNELSAVNRTIEAELMAVRVKNAELEAASIDIQAKNVQLEANNSGLQFECCVCINARPSVLYLPCKHLSVCNQCDVQIRKSKMHCPVCQAAIKTRHKSVHM